MSVAAHTLPRLLSGVTSSGRIGLSAHRAIHGPLPVADRGLIEELAAAGLSGCGGGAFPFAEKVRAVAKRRIKPIVVVNGSEGEPLSNKDKLLLTHLPHVVLDGAFSLASALNSNELVVAVESPAAHDAIVSAVGERPELQQRRLKVHIEIVPQGYVTGNETALMAVLSGRAPRPTLLPPYPFERGLKGKPTLVSNAETFAHAGMIASHGADWFRALGTAQSPGTRLVTVTGAVTRGGVIEVAGGTSMRSLLQAAGGPSEAVQGVLFGGYSGVWAGPEALDWQLGEAELRRHRATLGPGIVCVLGESNCVVADTARTARWLAGQRADQCGPCIHGLDAISESLEQLCERGDRSGAFEHLERWCELISGRGACALPDGAGRFVASALRAFRPAFEDHALHGRCEACLHTPVVRFPRNRELAGV